MIILESARKHDIDDVDMLAVISNPNVVAELRDEPEKLLFLGFDLKARALEVITDTGNSGEIFVVHADKITPSYEKLLEEAIK